MLTAFTKRSLVRSLKSRGLTGHVIVRRGKRVIAYSPQEMTLARKDVVTSDNIRSHTLACVPILDRNPYKLHDRQRARVRSDVRLVRA